MALLSFRRVAAAVFIAADAYVVLRIAPHLGMLGPVIQLAWVFCGIGALGVVLFNIPLWKRQR